MRVGLLHRRLVINWDEAHAAVRDAIDEHVRNPAEVLDTGKGWSYVTFFRPSTMAEKVLFDVDRLEALARSNGFFLPIDVVRQHNKIVVTAHSDNLNPSAQVFGLCKALEAYAAKFGNSKKYPHHGFYGKLGGFYDRGEKGRVLVMYATGDESLLEILGSLEELLPTLKVKGVTFTQHLSNGLSGIPRLLQGYGEAAYEEAGINYYRITDVTQFTSLLEQARTDYYKYRFESTPEA